MKNKRWVKENDRYVLYFRPFYDDEKVAEAFHEDDAGWCYSSELLNANNEYLGSDSLEEAQSDLEQLIIEHYSDEANYYLELLQKFKEGDPQDGSA